MGPKSLSVFIPVFNEEKLIDANLGFILRAIEKITGDFEILIIDDGSTDRSKEKILEWIKRYAKIRLIEHKTNLGYGAALRSGFRNAQKELIFYTDMDLPADLDELQKVMPLMETYDLVIGYRINRQDTPRRFIYSEIYKFLLRLLFNLKVKDINFSFKCIKKTAIEKINLSVESGFIDGELLIEAISKGFSIKEVPIIYRKRKDGKSNFNSLKVAISTAKEILFYWRGKVFYRQEPKGCA